MTDQAFHIIELLKKELYEEIAADEKAELEAWRSLNPGFIEELFSGKEYSAVVNEMLLYNKEGVRNKIAEKYPQVLNEKVVAPVHRVHFLRTAWFRYAAAVLIIAGVGAYLWNTSSIKDTPVIVAQKEIDVLPGSEKAILTLSDGRKVELTPQTEIIAETGINIQNGNGELHYGKGEKAVFNTMSTPRGGQYKLVLPDGSRVWLNAASSITFPTAFKGKSREVSITVEAYF
jgi:transmembrane sensor